MTGWRLWLSVMGYWLFHIRYKVFSRWKNKLEGPEARKLEAEALGNRKTAFLEFPSHQIDHLFGASAAAEIFAAAFLCLPVFSLPPPINAPTDQDRRFF